MLNIIIQGILSLFLVFIMAFIAYSVYNKEYVKKINDLIMYGNKKIVPIFTGRFEFSDKEVQIETYNKNMLGYKNVNPSKNQNGGAEYTYNFWLFYHLDNGKINSNLTNNTDYIILFFKGSKIKTMKYSNTTYECAENGEKKILIKNPLVKLRNDGKELLVEYNNINFPETYNNNAKPLTCASLIDSSTGNRISGGTSKKINDGLSSNKFGIKDINSDYYNDKFNMITIIFQENPSNEEVFNNNIANYRIYLNGELVEDRLANTNNIESTQFDNNFKSRVIKNNNSKLNINPCQYDNISKNAANKDTYLNETTRTVTLSDNLTNIAPLQIADFTYFNYAITTAEINSLYRKGYNTYLAKIDGSMELTNYDYTAKYIYYPTKDLSKPI
jgi:hypothetical protein